MRLERFVALAFLVSVRALAGTITVTNTSDGAAPGPAGSLRAAVSSAGAGDTIVFDAALAGQTITLTSGFIVVLQGLTIDGGTNRMTISGGNASSVFLVASAAGVTMNALTIRDGNDAGQGGGGLVNGGALTMNDCTVTSCVASQGGAGIVNGGTLTMNRCTVDGNVATGNNGGGIWNLGATAVLNMTNCTVSGNVAAAGNGGGIVSSPAGATVNLTYCTLAYNASSGTGGGVHAADGSEGAVTLHASILGQNQASASPDCSGTLVSGGSNVLTSASGCTFIGTPGTNLVADPKLGSLQRNGGLTRTHALQPGSPAMDFVQPGSCGINPTDQRELVRPQDGERNGTSVCDAGAYEAVKPIVVTSLLDPGDGTTCTLRQALTAASTNSVAGACPQGFIDHRVPDRITFGSTGGIHLGGTPLAASESVMIDGPGADKMLISGSGQSGVITLQDGSAANCYVLAGLAVIEGKAGTTSAGVHHAGSDDTLAVDRVYFTSDVNYLPPPVMPACIYAAARNVEVSRTSCVQSGTSRSAMHFVEANATLVDSTLQSPADGKVKVTAGEGKTASVSLVNVTFDSHTGYCLTLDGAGTRATYLGTILGNSNTSIGVGSGTFTSRGYNIANVAHSSLDGPGDLINTNPLLGVLAYHGGPVPTVNLKPGSPARDHIPAAAARTTIDQRGFPRPIGVSDVGAVERVIGGDVDGDGSVTITDVFSLINFLFAGGSVPVGEADVEGDGGVSVGDVFYLINRLFANGPAPI
jgi:hypothetical protein